VDVAGKIVTDLQQRAIRALLDVRVPEKNWHGARIESLNMRLTLTPDAKLGCTEEADLWFLVWRYRRQIENFELVAHADDLVNGRKHLEFEISL
jgi:hypothetical protein